MFSIDSIENWSREGWLSLLTQVAEECSVRMGLDVLRVQPVGLFWHASFRIESRTETSFLRVGLDKANWLKAEIDVLNDLWRRKQEVPRCLQKEPLGVKDQLTGLTWSCFPTN